MDDAELNAIRSARLAELQKNAGGSSSPAGASPQAAKADEAKLSMLSRLLEPSARERLSRVRIVRPDRAEQVEKYIVQLYSMGQISSKLNEQDVVQILDGLSRDEKKQNTSKIVYNRKLTFEDDDDDDFFD
ncbi:DNA-binding TFAR19-related protein [Suhomyces tanzawaensis NRRL Y-17324]|uniref:DNA-binding TFAR19-related protein n=1 Tax=Suhomyces tanzawaensis NRRL Y-17324 TaxID=984487 RepID=A0A1E4SNV5_9ASCO|nr:DNA-binding TFAR19-related protein [Suhomyces tanzawaensis NRRL Y-17324]ODV81210.1 DNA-binding TFAR19-related protein [Suhomyces tanzawaensis NRRL Y-17324]